MNYAFDMFYIYKQWNMLLIMFVSYGILGSWAAKLKPANLCSSIQCKCKHIIFLHIPELRHHSLNIHRPNATVWEIDFMQKKKKKSLKESNKSLQKLRVCLARSLKVVNICVKSIVMMSRWSGHGHGQYFEAIILMDWVQKQRRINCLSRRVTKVENPSKWK